MEPLFIDNDNIADGIYKNLFKCKNERMKEAKNYAEELWQKYHLYADMNFKSHFQHDCRSRYWEMYLTCTLLEYGLQIKKNNTGPDNLIETSEGRIWIEAIAPNAGDENNPDRVPEDNGIIGEAQNVPEDKIILRYRSAIQEKYNNRYWNYRKKGVIDDSDSYVIAINASKVPNSLLEVNPPRIVKSVFPIGDMQIKLDRDSLAIKSALPVYRESVNKESGTSIFTNIFLDESYRYLSAVIFSTIDPVNRPEILGSDFIVVHNPLAANSIPHGFLKIGQEYSQSYNTEDSFELVRKDWDRDEV